jgi:imidazoleglycerol phosphate dehydratase HisB
VIRLRQGGANLEARGAISRVKIDLDGSGHADIVSGSAFLDHMIAAFCRTSQVNLEAKAEASSYHKFIALGRSIGLAMNDALGDHAGIRRYGSAAVPMDESLAEVALDFSGRPYLVFRGAFSGNRIGDLDIQEIKAFMESLADGARITLHIRFCGENDHHKAESIFKALGFAIRKAVRKEGSEIPSTKGMI